MENYTALEPDVNGINRAVIKQRLAKVITKTLPKDDTLTTTDILHERSKKVSYFLDVNRIKRASDTGSSNND